MQYSDKFHQYYARRGTIRLVVPPGTLLHAGTVMVYCPSAWRHTFLFQLLGDVVADDDKLLGYMEGSGVWTNPTLTILPSRLLLNINCRLPYEDELEFYAKCTTV